MFFCLGCMLSFKYTQQFYWQCFSLCCVCVSTHVCMRAYMLMPTCVCVCVCVGAGVRAYPPVCVCTLLGSDRQLTGGEKTASVAEETDIDAEEVSQVPAEESDSSRGVTDLDATANTTGLNHTESKVGSFVCVFVYLLDGRRAVCRSLTLLTHFSHYHHYSPLSRVKGLK